MELEVKGEHLERMAFIKREVEKAVLPYRQNTEAALVCGALFQICKTLLNLYPEAVRRDLLEGAIAFLEGRDVAQEQLEARSSRVSGLYPGIQ